MLKTRKHFANFLARKRHWARFPQHSLVCHQISGENLDWFCVAKKNLFSCIRGIVYDQNTESRGVQSRRNSSEVRNALIN